MHGIGLGPQVAFLPGTISTYVAQLNTPRKVAMDGAGNLYIAEVTNDVVLKVDKSGNITTYAGNGTAPSSTSFTSADIGDGGPAASAELNDPEGLAVDGAGNLYIADKYSQCIRKVDEATQVITTAAGTCNYYVGYNGDGGPATGAHLATPTGVTVDGAGNLYIADSSNYVIRKVEASTGIITTVAGNGTRGYMGDGQAATSAELDSPVDVAVDAKGNLFINDFINDPNDPNNSVIRKVNTSGVITTYAGGGTPSSGIGDGGLATSAQLNNVYGVAVDGMGNLYIADVNHMVIRKVDRVSRIITTVAGNGTYGYSGDNGPATSAQLKYPTGVAVDGAGNLYIADYNNSVIRKVDVSTPSTLTFPTTTAIGSIDTADGAQTVTVANIGNANLTFFDFTPSNAALGTSTCSTSTPLAPRDSCTLGVEFSPSVAGVSPQLQGT